MKTQISILAILVVALATTAGAADSKKKAAPSAAHTTETTTTTASAPKKMWSRNYSYGGCGWGSTIVGKRREQYIASSSNMISANQSFAITTGTSNCTDSSTDRAAIRMDKFVVSNKVAIAGEMARGQGETLANLSSMLGCQNDAEFARVMKANFRSIFSSESVQPNEVTDSIIVTVQGSESLSGTCSAVI